MNMLKNINLKSFNLDRLKYVKEDAVRFQKIKDYLLSKEDFFTYKALTTNKLSLYSLVSGSLKSINIKHWISNFIGLFSTVLFILLSFSTDSIQMLVLLFVFIVFHNYIGIKNIITDYVHTVWSREVLYNLFVLLSVYSIYSFLSL